MLQAALLLEWERGAVFLFVPVLLGAGAAIYFSAAAEPRWTSLVASAVALSAFALLARRRVGLHLTIVAALVVVLGMLAGKVETWRAGTKVLGSEIATRLTGRLVSAEHQANGRVRLVIDVIGTERPRLRYAPDRVRVSARRAPEGLKPGDAIVGVVRLQPPSGPVRPGGYDFSFESYFDGIGAVGFFLSGPERTDAPAAGGVRLRLARALETARESLAARIESQIGGAEGEIAAALVAGVRGGIPEEANEALRKSGLAHILSISGLHMALVAALVMQTLRIAFAFFPGFASRVPVKKIAASGALVATAAYLALSGSDVAAGRSFVMLAVVLLALLFDRAALTMRNLAIAATVILLMSPHEVTGPSFQMSFAATAALVGAFAAWSEWRRRRAPPPPSRRHWLLAGARTLLLGAAGLVAASFVAGTATALFGAYHFQRISPLGAAANLVAAPVIWVVMLAGVLALVAMPFGLDGWPLWLMGKAIGVVLWIAESFAAMSPVDAVGLAPPGALIAVSAALILALFLSTWLRLTAVPVLGLGLLLLAFRATPAGFVAEDASLLAIRTSDGALAVSRDRPNGFAVENWSRALITERLLRPSEKNADGFTCEGELCRAGGIVLATSGQAGRKACGDAAVLVVDDPTMSEPCDGGALTITRRDLARHGSAALFLEGGVAGVSYAIAEPYRPWHEHRRFSREARGKPSYKPKPKKEATATPPATR